MQVGRLLKKLEDTGLADTSLIFFTSDNDLAQEKNLIDRPEHRDLIERLHAKFLKHNDHNEETRDPRTTRAFRVAK